jgi:hypothetical protein
MEGLDLSAIIEQPQPAVVAESTEEVMSDGEEQI